MKSGYLGVTIALLLVLSFSVSLTGCGGGGGSELAGPKGSMSFAVNFPPLPKSNSKVLPSVLMSVVIDILDADKAGNPPKVDPIILNRPDTAGGKVTVNVPDVGVGNTLIKARGYDALDGGGKLIIIASTTCIVLVNQTVSVSMTMGTTTTTIILSGAGSVLVGGTTPLTASATDVEGNYISNPDFDWASSDEAVATVVPDAGKTGSKAPPSKQATVTGVKRGQVTITVTDKTSGADAKLDMNVNPDINEVVLNPSTKTVNKDLTFTLTAKAFTGSTEISNVDFTFTSENLDTASVVKTAGLKNESTVTGVAPGKTRIEVTQPYTAAKSYCDVTVTETGNIDITIQ